MNPEAVSQALRLTYEALAKPRPAPRELRSECCGALAPGELDRHNIGRCPRCREFNVFGEASDAS